MLALITDEPRAWHTRALQQAFRRRGFVARCVDLRTCHFDLARAGHGVVIPGFAPDLPRAVFVRGVPGGTLEQVVLRLDILHALRELGVPVYNDARAIERSVDKAMTSFLLHQHGVPTPPTWALEETAQTRRLCIRQTRNGAELVAKPLFGSQGKDLQRIKAGEEAPLMQGVAYLQRWLPPARAGAFEDWRVLVAGGRALAAMRRASTHWITNIAQGAQPCPVDLAQPEGAALARLAVAAAAALGMDYAGVDLMRDAQTPGRLVVIEVNGAPAWRGLQQVTGTNLAQALADDLLTRKAGLVDAAMLQREAG